MQFKIDAKELDKELKELDLSEIDGAIVELTLTNLDINLSVEIDNSYLKSHFESASFVKIKRELIQSSSGSIENVEALTLQEYFLEHIDSQIDDIEQKQRVMSKAKELFSIVDSDGANI